MPLLKLTTFTVLAALLLFLVFSVQGQAKERIINGAAVEKSDWPALGAISNGRAVFDGHVCAGNLVHPRWVLTAAHCLPYISLKRGSITFREDLRFKGGLRRAIVGKVRHPLFKRKNLAYDFGLLYLGRPIHKIKRQKLVTKPPSSGAKLAIAGWGTTKFGGEPSPFLQGARIFLRRFALCRKAYPNVPKSTFCAGSPNGHDSCQGDSGGAATWQGRVVGIVSSGRGCGKKRYPGRYSLVAKAAGWIKSVIKKGSRKYRDRRPLAEVPYNPFVERPWLDIYKIDPSRYMLNFYINAREKIEFAEASFLHGVSFCHLDATLCEEKVSLRPVLGTGRTAWSLDGEVGRRCVSFNWRVVFKESRIPAKRGLALTCPILAR